MVDCFSASELCSDGSESSECGFESWLRPWCLCPSGRHFTIIASLHPGVNGYLWGQSWLLSVWLALYAPKWQQLSCILPRELRWFQEWFMSLMSRSNNGQRLDLVAKPSFWQFQSMCFPFSSEGNYHCPDENNLRKLLETSRYVFKASIHTSCKIKYIQTFVRIKIV